MTNSTHEEPIKEEQEAIVYAEVPYFGYKADLTEEFLAQTMEISGVKYHRHKHGGGWVSEKAKVDQTVWIGPFAVVHSGVIKDQVVINDHAVIDCPILQVKTSSNLSDSAEVSGFARVCDSARVYGDAWVCGSARVYGDAQVFDSARVFGFARVYDDARVYGDAQVFDSARVYDDARVYGDAWVFGFARISGEGYLETSADIDIELKNWETVK